MIHVYAYDYYHQLPLSIVVSQDTDRGEVVQAVFIARHLHLHYLVVCDSVLFVTDAEGSRADHNGYVCTKWDLQDAALNPIIEGIVSDFNDDLITVVRKQVA